RRTSRRPGRAPRRRIRRRARSARRRRRAPRRRRGARPAPPRRPRRRRPTRPDALRRRAPRPRRALPAPRNEPMTRSGTRRRLPLVVALAPTLALALATGAARADTNTADVESARALYHDGRALRDAGDLAGSLAKFKAAHAVLPTPITAIECGRALELV